MAFESDERKKKFIICCVLLLILYGLPNKNGNKYGNSLRLKLSKYSVFKIFFGGFTLSYIFCNFLILFGFGPPNIPEHHYHPDFVNLRKFLTGMDAGIVSSIHIKPLWLRQIIQIILGAYFILFPNKAEDRMLRFHQNPTIEGIRLCWEKGRHPLLWSAAQLQQPLKIKIHRKLIPILRKVDGSVIKCYMYFQGTLNELKNARHVVINYPGGGFVAMNHLHHETYVRKWANYLRIPILSVDYRKAPEFPYPNGFNDAYEVYKTIVQTNGKVLGIKTDKNDPIIKVVLAGDSAGGNFVAAVCCRAIIEKIKIPDGLLMAYPVLDLNLNLFRAINDVNDFNLNATNAITLHSHMPSDIGVRSEIFDSNNEQHLLSKYLKDPIISKLVNDKNKHILTDIHNENKRLKGFDKILETKQPGPLSSRIMYFNDGVLPIKYMLILGDAYLPTHSDPINDMFISPIAATNDILSQFPCTRIHVGSVDPLVDDSRRFVKKLKYANSNIDVILYEWAGLSHAYIQSPSFLLSQSRHSCEMATAWIAGMLNIDVKNRDTFEYDVDNETNKNNAQIINEMMQQSKL